MFHDKSPVGLKKITVAEIKSLPGFTYALKSKPDSK
jgi:hypothetical protein